MADFLTHLQFILRGGFMMWPLLASGLLALVIVIERSLLLHRRLKTPAKEVSQLLDLVQHHRLEEALGQSSESRSPVINVLHAGLKNLNLPTEDVELSMQNEAEAWIPVVEKHLDWLDTIITAAPLMGLLGTITGMMASFQVLSEKGVNEPTAITGGVAEALIATATGLIIALLSLVAYNHLNQRVKRFIFEMESAASKLIEIRNSALRKAP